MNGIDQERIRTQFDTIAAHYDAGRRCLIPCFDDYYVRSVSVVKNLKPQAANIVDLGAGTGLLTQQMYQLYPQSRFTLIDLSDEMLAVARQRFQGLPNIECRVADYTAEIPEGAELICSALSIHHLENVEKQQLYQAVYEALPEGGVFVNLDQFCAESPHINEAWDEWWQHYIDHSGITDDAKAKWRERKKLDREVSMAETHAMLRAAGFQHVACIYQFMKFGTVVALK